MVVVVVAAVVVVVVVILFRHGVGCFVPCCVFVTEAATTRHEID